MSPPDDGRRSRVTVTSRSDAERRLKAEVEDLQRWLTFEELRDLAEKSDKLFADALAPAKARRVPMLVGVTPSPTAGVDDVVTGEPTELSAAPTVNDERDATRAETAPPDPP